MENSRLKEVLAIVNNKGGVGKTTTVQSLAAALVRRKKSMRVVDRCPSIRPTARACISHQETMPCKTWIATCSGR